MIYFLFLKPSHLTRDVIFMIIAVDCLIAFGKPAGHREVAPRELDVHSRWLTLYQISTAPSKVAPGTMYEPVA